MSGEVDAKPDSESVELRDLNNDPNEPSHQSEESQKIKRKVTVLTSVQITNVIVSCAIGGLAIAALVVALTVTRCGCEEGQNIETLITQNQQLATDVQELRALVASLTQDVSYAPFENCTTSIEASCLVPASASAIPSSLPCGTAAVPLNVTGSYAADVSCVYVGNVTNDLNPLLGTPMSDGEGGVRCLCAVVVVNTDILHTNTVTCGLQVTRCPTQQTIQLTTA